MTNGEWTKDAVLECVLDTVREVLPVGEHFTAESSLIAAGLDSLAVTQLMLAIEDKTGVWVDESRLTPENLENAAMLAACVYEQMASPS